MSNLHFFDGRLAAAPALTNHGNNTQVCKFTLIRNEFAGTDDGGEAREERKVALQFTAFGPRAKAIHDHCFEGDQLIITSRIENNDYQDSKGADKYGFNFIVVGFDFGAPGPKKREMLANRT